MNSIQIEKVNPSHLISLQQIGRKTFLETFGNANSEEDMQNYLEEGFSKEKLTSELENKDIEFYFAILNSEIIGYLKINFAQAQTEIKDKNALEIERIYVLQEFHGNQVGQVLFEKALEVAKDKKLSYIWLGVWEENLRAIQFYQKNGFVAFDKHIFKLGEDLQTDVMMRLKLEK
ncbi:MAG: GNAT family N-acetyltransferase [Flavobacteriia bacterium]|jgi:ribosomal protein S18 acetylase RimI-like enzyme